MMPGMGPTNNKQTPAWDPSWEEQYPFASWAQDILLWSAATDLDEERQAPSIVLQLGHCNVVGPRTGHPHSATWYEH